MNTDKKEKINIYMGDIHNSSYFVDFIKKITKKYNDKEIEFHILGDIFNRGKSAFLNIKEIMKLSKKYKTNIVLGNHDLFFIYGLSSQAGTEHFKEIGLYDKNYESQVLKELKKNNDILFQDSMNYYFKLGVVNGLLGNIDDFIGRLDTDKIYKEIQKVIDFLHTHGKLYHIDDNKNILLHGGIPFHPSGLLLGEFLDGKFRSGIELLDYYNNGFKTFDSETLKKFSLYYSANYRTLIEGHNEMHYNKERVEIEEFSKDFLPNWYNNSLYYTNDNIKQSLNTYLDSTGLNYIITGHWYNNKFKNEINERSINLDRSNQYVYDPFLTTLLGMDTKIKREIGEIPPERGNIGYCVLDEFNKLLEIGDLKDIKNIKHTPIKPVLKIKKKLM